MENEWFIKLNNIRHTSCQYEGYINPTWNTNDKSPKGDLWCCIKCNKKAPESLILQWKLLYGK